MNNWCYFAFLIEILHTLHINQSAIYQVCLQFHAGCILAKAEVLITLKTINAVT